MRALPRSAVALALIAALTLTPAMPATATLGEWRDPVMISDAGQFADRQQIVTDGTLTTAIWRRYDGSRYRIQSSSSTNGGATWSTPVMISDAGRPADQAQVVTDGTTTTAAWLRLDEFGSYRIQAASSSDGGATWSTPVTLSEAGQDAWGQRLATNGSTIVAVWDRSDGSNHRIQSTISTDGGATWSTPVTLSDVGHYSEDTQLVMNGTTVTAVWSYWDGTHNRTQAAFSANSGATWSTPVFLSAAGHNTIYPHAVSDGTTITAVWAFNDGSHTRVQASSSTDGGATWSSPVFVSAAGGNALRPKLTTDGSTITSSWYRHDGVANRIQVAASTDGGATWSTPVTLSPPGLPAAQPTLVADGFAVTVIWYGDDGSHNRIQASSLTPMPEVNRLAGANRYETAVEISSEFAPDVPVVYLATGTNYPDALSAASAAALQGGPLLLTAPNSLPTVVSDELVRLNPDLVVIVGGTGVVSASVQATVEALLPGATVRRDAGVNRYETSRAIAENAFPADTTAGAFIATGANFPDALSASAAAGVAGAPVILVNGTGTTIDTATQDLLEILGVTEIVIAGGTGVVSVAIENALKTIVGADNVIRLSGSDRYATSVAINAASFDSASTVFLATGVDYPDALAGAALAGNVGAPLFVVPRTCVPASVRDQLLLLRTTEVTLLGGTGVLTSGVENLTSC